MSELSEWLFDGVPYGTFVIGGVSITGDKEVVKQAFLDAGWLPPKLSTQYDMEL